MRFLIDANLPYRFELWRGMAFIHVFISRVWPQAAALIETHKLVIIHTHTIECIA